MFLVFRSVFFGNWYFKFLPDARQAVQSFTFVLISFFFSGHQKSLASVSIFVIPEWPKCRISSNLLLRSIGTTVWSSTNTRPHRIDNFSNTGLYPSGAVSRSSLLMLVLTRVSSGSMRSLKLMSSNPA